MGRTLLAAFEEVTDPRAARGLRHPLPAVLTLMTVAMLSGARSLYAIAQWGRLQGPAVVAAMGFTRATTPAVSTLHGVSRRIDPVRLEAALSGWAQRWHEPGDAIALDGKALRGSHARGAPPSGWVDAVAAYAQEAGLVLAQAGGQRGQTRSGTDGGAPRARGAAAGGGGGHG